MKDKAKESKRIKLSDIKSGWVLHFPEWKAANPIHSSRKTIRIPEGYTRVLSVSKRVRKRKNVKTILFICEGCIIEAMETSKTSIDPRSIVHRRVEQEVAEIDGLMCSKTEVVFDIIPKEVTIRIDNDDHSAFYEYTIPNNYKGAGSYPYTYFLVRFYKNLNEFYKALWYYLEVR